MSEITPWQPTKDVGILEGLRLNREARQANAEMRRAGTGALIRQFHADLANREQLQRQAQDDQRRRDQMARTADRTLLAGRLGVEVYDEFARLTNGDPGRAEILSEVMKSGLRRVNHQI